MSTSQTLDRGLAVLESIAWATAPPTIDELAEAHGVHRSIAYRIVRTLEARHLVRRDASGRCHAGVRLASLARGVRAPLLTAAVPVLTSLANELGMTSFLVVRDGDEAVTSRASSPRRVRSTSRTVRGSATRSSSGRRGWRCSPAGR